MVESAMEVNLRVGLGGFKISFRFTGCPRQRGRYVGKTVGRSLCMGESVGIVADKGVEGLKVSGMFGNRSGIAAT